MKNIEEDILGKCGWNSKQLGFLGTMVCNVTDSKGTSIMDIVSYRTSSEVAVEWFIPNKEGDKISFSYSKVTGQLIPEKTTSEIKNLEDVNVFLTAIESNVKNTRGSFFPSQPIAKSNDFKMR